MSVIKIYAFIFLLVQTLNLSFIDSVRAFTCSEGGFSIWMPGEPVLQEVFHKTFVGKIKENSYILETDTETYSSSYTELPGIALSFVGKNGLLKKAKKGFLKATGAQEISYRKIIFEGKEGAELAFQIPAENRANPASGKARFFIFGKKLYVMTMTSNQGQAGIALIDRYLDSFQLISSPANEFSLNALPKK